MLNCTQQNFLKFHSCNKHSPELTAEIQSLVGRVRGMYAAQIQLLDTCHVCKQHPDGQRRGFGTQTEHLYWRAKLTCRRVNGTKIRFSAYLHVLVWCLGEAQRRGSIRAAAEAVEAERARSGSQHVSHLCHVKNCINMYHLYRESPTVNNQRKQCREKGVCDTHENSPACLF